MTVKRRVSWTIRSCPHCGGSEYTDHSDTETVRVCLGCGRERAIPLDPIPAYQPSQREQEQQYNPLSGNQRDDDWALAVQARRTSIGTLFAAGVADATTATITGVAMATVWRAVRALEKEGGELGEQVRRVRQRRLERRGKNTICSILSFA